MAALHQSILLFHHFPSMCRPSPSILPILFSSPSCLFPHPRASAELPWGSCGNWWNTETCVNPYNRNALECWDETFNTTVSETFCKVGNLTHVPVSNLTDPVKEFWE